MDQKRELIQNKVKEYLNTLDNYHATLPWFLLSSDIGINLVTSYFDEFEANSTSHTILTLYLKCRNILINPSIVHDINYIRNFLALIPEENWKRRIEAEINSSSTNKNIKFDLLIDYKRYLYHQFKACDIFRKFKEQVITKSNHLTEMLTKLYESYENTESNKFV